MKALAPVALVLTSLVLPVALFAQADPHVYTDPAMSFTAPADFSPLAVPSSPPDGLDGPTVVAAFGRHPRQPDANVITVRLENYDGDLQSYEEQVESQARSQGSDSVFVRKQLTTLPNGMPAYYMAITIGQDSGEMRVFQYVWVDHVRGVVLADTGRYGTIDDNSAKKALSEVSAVAYPRNRY